MKLAKIFYSAFQLNSDAFWNNQSQTKTRDGVLLKVQFNENLFGYSCYNPWPELGDETWSEGLAKLNNGSSTKLIEQAFYWAEVDAKARAEKICLREMIKPLKNHYLVRTQSIELDPKAHSAFKVLKIKMGRDLTSEESFLQNIVKELPDKKLRLDFNGNLSFKEFYGWWSKISETIKSKIDFVEDPFNPETVNNEADLDNKLWAWDFFKDQVTNAQTVVIKPTRSLLSTKENQRRVFTHSFDHPLGLVISHYAASQSANAEIETHGLFYQGVQCSDDSQKEFSYDDNVMLIANTGTGFGFDQLLKSLDWKSL